MSDTLCEYPTCPLEAIPGLKYCAQHVTKVTSMSAPLITSKGKQNLKVHLATLATKPSVMPGATGIQWIPPVTIPAGPKTQKAKGIKTLQSAGMLASGFAKIALTEQQAIDAAISIGLPCFCRPCPVTPRHGFVDSREVKTPDDVRQVWSEARAADPEAELILMPFIKATHNMVWRPGLLSVGPGHDGATAGHDSISIFLQADYSQQWKNMATQAGVNLETGDPFIEAVAGKAHETVLTQIRGGVKGSPTEPDWNPSPMTIGAIVMIDDNHKKDPGSMLAWETTAKTLKPGYHVVYNPGGNLGDHWSVHAQIAGVTVITSFKPVVGQTLAKMGVDLPELEPQAVIFGFLGGVLSPDLSDNVMRKRAVAAALLGSHHGMRMGGDSGIFIGASVALMLRLAQAALWGEARHAEEGSGKTLSREQIYKGILNDWLKGRQGLKGKISLFWSHSWAGGFGGKAWAACAKGTTDLDRAMLDLVKLPSRENAKKVLAALTNVVNLAHNNGWWMNKFITAEWFDLAVNLDPRVAILAGPAWYESATAPVDQRMALLDVIEGLSPVDLSDLEAKYFSVDVEAKAKKTINKGKGKVKATVADTSLPTPSSMEHNQGQGVGQGTKLGSFGNAQYGKRIRLPFLPTKALAKAGGTGLIHLQVANAEGEYYSGEVIAVPPNVFGSLHECSQGPSLSGSGISYQVLTIKGSTVYVGSYALLSIVVKGS